MEQLKNFVESNDSEIIYRGLGSNQRKLIHEAAECLGLSSRSEGLGDDRYVVVQKAKQSVKIDRETIRKFVEHFKLPINVYDPELIEYYVGEFDDFYQTNGLYDIFINYIRSNPSSNSTSAKIAGQIEKDITDSTEYKAMITTKPVEYGELPSNTNIYIRNSAANHTCYYISIDLIEANFTSIRMLMPNKFSGINCWRDFLLHYTTEPFYLESKHFRQVVLGQLNHKRIINVEYKLMSELYIKLKDQFNIIGKVNSDEIIIEVTKDNIFDTFNQLKKLIDTKLWRITPFKIDPIGSTSFFLKTDYDDLHKECRLSIKNVPKAFHLQAMKFVKNIPIIELDRKTTIKEGKYEFTATMDKAFDFG